MHELSIALSILEIAQKEALCHQAKKVTELEIEVGKLSGVDPEALAFVLESVVRNTPLDGCRVQILPIEGKYRCMSCGLEYLTPDMLTECPRCGSLNRELTGGKELKLKSLLID